MQEDLNPVKGLPQCSGVYWCSRQWRTPLLALSATWNVSPREQPGPTHTIKVLGVLCSGVDRILPKSDWRAGVLGPCSERRRSHIWQCG
jgi:hypothetical protein